jgi:hypothetical protein
MQRGILQQPVVGSIWPYLTDLLGITSIVVKAMISKRAFGIM